MALETNKNNLVSIKDSFSKYVVQPLNSFGLGGLVFDVERDTVINKRANLSKHFVEDNSAVQDHMAIEPTSITLKSYVGELVNIMEPKSDPLVQNLTQKLTILTSYLPNIISTAKNIKESIINQDFNIENITNVGLDLWSLSKNLNPAATKQAQAYMYLESLMDQKILVAVQTPYKFFTNMAVVNTTAIQPEDSKYLTDISVTLQEVRTTDLDFVLFDESKYQSRNKQQRQDVKNKGSANGEQQSLASNIFGFFSTPAGLQ